MRMTSWAKSEPPAPARRARHLRGGGLARDQPHDDCVAGLEVAREYLREAAVGDAPANLDRLRLAARSQRVDRLAGLALPSPGGLVELLHRPRGPAVAGRTRSALLGRDRRRRDTAAG